MRRLASLSWILVVIISSVAWGQPRTQQSLMEQISRLRLEISRIDDTIKRLSTNRAQLENRLEELARKIQVRKTSESQERFIPDFALQDMLRASHDASELLSSVLKQLDILRRDRRNRLEKLSEVIRLLLVEIADEIQDVPDEKKAKLLRLLSRLRYDRDAVARQLDTRLDALPPMDTSDLLDTNDPEELIERADALRDEQDRLRRRLVELEKRIKGLNNKIRIDRQMRDFQRDQLLFAERSRVFQLVGPGTSAEIDDFSDNQAPKPLPETDTRDPSQTDFLEPCLGASCDVVAESVLDPGIDRVSILEEQGYPNGSADQQKIVRRMNASDELRILTRARGGIIQQIKQLQILYDRVMEKAETLETD